MEKVFVLMRRTLLNVKLNDWSCWRTLYVYRSLEDAEKQCMVMRNAALAAYDNTVDYTVVSFNVL